MAGPNEILDKSAHCDEALEQFHFVQLTGVERVAEPAGAGQFVYGVTQDKISEDDAARGRVVRVRTLGASTVVAGGVVEQGDPVAAAADGRAVAATEGQYVVGRAWVGAPAADDRMVVLLTYEGEL